LSGGYSLIFFLFLIGFLLLLGKCTLFVRCHVRYRHFGLSPVNQTGAACEKYVTKHMPQNENNRIISNKSRAGGRCHPITGSRPA
jgi:hypothetical protein